MVRNCNSFLLSIITAFLFLASSCDVDTATLGSSLMPESDNVTTSQVAYKVNTRSVFIDSVLANTKTCYLGCIIDPETRAKTTSDFLAQFHMMENYRLPKKEKMLVDNVNDINKYPYYKIYKTAGEHSHKLQQLLVHKQSYRLQL